jgi:hypothetical protein
MNQKCMKKAPPTRLTLLLGRVLSWFGKDDNNRSDVPHARSAVADGPAIDRRMVDPHAALAHHFFDVSVAQRVGRAPADADQDDIDRET